MRYSEIARPFSSLLESADAQLEKFLSTARDLLRSYHVEAVRANHVHKITAADFGMVEHEIETANLFLGTDEDWQDASVAYRQYRTKALERQFRRIEEIMAPVRDLEPNAKRGGRGFRIVQANLALMQIVSHRMQATASRDEAERFKSVDGTLRGANRFLVKGHPLLASVFVIIAWFILFAIHRQRKRPSAPEDAVWFY